MPAAVRLNGSPPPRRGRARVRVRSRGTSTSTHAIPQQHPLLRLTVDDAGGLQAGRTVSPYAQRPGDAVVEYVLGRLRDPVLLREGGAVQEHGPAGSPPR